MVGIKKVVLDKKTSVITRWAEIRQVATYFVYRKLIILAPRKKISYFLLATFGMQVHMANLGVNGLVVIARWLLVPFLPFFLFGYNAVGLVI